MYISFDDLDGVSTFAHVPFLRVRVYVGASPNAQELGMRISKWADFQYEKTEGMRTESQRRAETAAIIFCFPIKLKHLIKSPCGKALFCRCRR